MQHIAIVCMATAAVGGALLLGWLWQMASADAVPAWLRRVHERDARGPNSGDFL